MVCPAGSVNVSVQPLTAVLPVFVMVMFDVRPVFQALIVSLTRHAPPPGGGEVGGGEVGGGEVGGGDVGGGELGGGELGGGDVGVVLFNPKNAIVYAAMPGMRMLCVPPWMLMP